MILKPFTGICLLAAAGSGLYLYQIKHHAQVLERNIARTMKAADGVRQRAGLMRAEYALLNDPSRLAELSEQLLPGLKTTAPGQFASLTDFEKRLPAIGAPPTLEPLEPQAPDAVLPKAAPKPEQGGTEPPKLESAKPEPNKVEPAKPEPPRQPLIASRPVPPRPTVLAAAAPAPATAPSALAIAAAPLPQVAPAPSAAVVATPLAPVVATPLPPPRPPSAPMAATPVTTQPFAGSRAPSPLPLHAATVPARAVAAPVATPIAATPIVARPAPPPTAARPAYASPAYVAPAYAPPVTPAVGSALGMARTMPAASVLTPARSPGFTATGGQ